MSGSQEPHAESTGRCNRTRGEEPEERWRAAHHWPHGNPAPNTSDDGWGCDGDRSWSPSPLPLSLPPLACLPANSDEDEKVQKPKKRRSCYINEVFETRNIWGWGWCARKPEQMAQRNSSSFSTNKASTYARSLSHSLSLVTYLLVWWNLESGRGKESRVMTWVGSQSRGGTLELLGVLLVLETYPPKSTFAQRWQSKKKGRGRGRGISNWQREGRLK